MTVDIQRREETLGHYRVPVVLIGLLLFCAHDAHAGDPAAPQKPAAATPTVDLDLLLNQLQPLGEDPAFGGVVVPQGDELLRMMLGEIPDGRRAQVAPGLLDARMVARVAMEIPASLEIRVLRFRDSEIAASFVAAWRAASEEEDARKDSKPGAVLILEATYEKGAGPDGRMNGFVARKKSTRNEHGHKSHLEVAQIGPIAVRIDVADLVDITRRELDQALVRLEAAVADPEGARKASRAGPVLLSSLGPTLLIRTVGADGSAVPRFTYRVSWEEAPGSYTSDSGYAENGVALARVHGPSTVEVWAARSDEDKPLPWGPASTEVKAGARDAEIKLPKGMSLSGIVRDRQGKPLEGIRVVAFSAEGALGIPAKMLPPGGLPMSHGFEGHSQDQTGPSGTFDLQGLGPSRYRVTVAADGEWYTVNDIEADAGSEPVSLVIEKALSVEVVVLGTDDKPLAGAKVSAYPTQKGHFSAGFMRDLTFDTDASGVARMRRLRPGGNYRLTVLPPDGRKDLTVSVQADWSPAATTLRLLARGAGDR